ncbi:unnamed protein product, partial [Durusdinium trenchii]
FGTAKTYGRRHTATGQKSMLELCGGTWCSNGFTNCLLSALSSWSWCFNASVRTTRTTSTDNSTSTTSATVPTTSTDNTSTADRRCNRPISWSGLRPTDEVCTPLTASSRREPLSYISQKWKRACALL